MNKIECPQCHGRRCFRRYIDEEGKITFPDTVGRCDHENHCGYNYTPKEYFADNPDVKCSINDEYCTYQNTTLPYQRVSKPVAIPPSFISPDIMKKSLACYDINPLFMFLAQHMSKANALALFKKYDVGTSRHWGGSVVFWQVDKDGNVRTGKVMAYNNDGHRVKEPVSKITWAHSLLKLPDFNLQQCLFGEHLLKENPDKQVALVESEKTALIGAFYLPQYVWLATGGKGICWKKDVLSVLKDRQVILFPDLKATDDWKAKIPLLQSAGADAHVFEGLESVATDAERDAGLDIGDFLLRVDGAEAIAQQLANKYPAFQSFKDKLKLQVVGFDPV